MSKVREWLEAIGLRQIILGPVIPVKTETIVADARPETLLIFDNATVVLEMGRGGKFYAKSSGWEANRTILDSQKIEIWSDKGRWFIGRTPREVKKPAVSPLNEDDFQTA